MKQWLFIMPGRRKSILCPLYKKQLILKFPQGHSFLSLLAMSMYDCSPVCLVMSLPWSDVLLKDATVDLIYFSVWLLLEEDLFVAVGWAESKNSFSVPWSKLKKDLPFLMWIHIWIYMQDQNILFLGYSVFKEQCQYFSCSYSIWLKKISDLSNILLEFFS